MCFRRAPRLSSRSLMSSSKSFISSLLIIQLITVPLILVILFRMGLTPSCLSGDGVACSPPDWLLLVGNTATWAAKSIFVGGGTKNSYNKSITWDPLWILVFVVESGNVTRRLSWVHLIWFPENLESKGWDGRNWGECFKMGNCLLNFYFFFLKKNQWWEFLLA